MPTGVNTDATLGIVVLNIATEGLKDIKVSLCGLLYSKNRTRGAFMVPKGDRMEHMATG